VEIPQISQFVFSKGAKVSGKTAKQPIVPSGQKFGSFKFAVNSLLLCVPTAPLPASVPLNSKTYSA
jgi:hypothetical protein